METSYVRGTQSFPRTWWRPETPLARIAREKTGSRCQVPGPVRQRADILEIAMVSDNAKLLLRLLWRPADAMSGILDQGSLLFASLAVLAVSLLVQYSVQSVIPRAPVAAQHAAQPRKLSSPTRINRRCRWRMLSPGGRSASMLRSLSWLWCMFPGR